MPHNPTCFAENLRSLGCLQVMFNAWIMSDWIVGSGMIGFCWIGMEKRSVSRSMDLNLSEEEAG